MELLASLACRGNPLLGLMEEGLIVFVLGTFMGTLVVGILDAEDHMSQETLSDEVNMLTSCY